MPGIVSMDALFKAIEIVRQTSNSISAIAVSSNAASIAQSINQTDPLKPPW